MFAPKTYFKCYFPDKTSKSEKLLTFSGLDVQAFRQIPDAYYMSCSCENISTGQRLLWKRLSIIRERVESMAGGRFEMMTLPGMVDGCEAEEFDFQLSRRKSLKEFDRLYNEFQLFSSDT